MLVSQASKPYEEPVGAEALRVQLMGLTRSESENFYLRQNLMATAKLGGKKRQRQVQTETETAKIEST